MDDLAAVLQRIEAEQQRFAAEQRELRGLLEQVLAKLSQRKARCRPSRSRRDEAVELANLQTLVPAIWAALGQKPDPFTVADLFGIADHRLQKALGESGLDAQRLGSTLSNWAGRRVDYSVIRRAGMREGVAVWRIEPVSVLGLGDQS